MSSAKVMTVIFLLFATTAHALTPDEPLPNATLEKRAQNLFHEIRCVVCQSEAISDSPAAIARDMRQMIRAEIASGTSDDEIKNQLQMTYGERIFMMPQQTLSNIWLWLAPALLLLVGGGFAWAQLFKRSRA